MKAPSLMWRSLFSLYRKSRRISYKAKKCSALARTAVERNLSLRDPPQTENPALQDSIFASKEDVRTRLKNKCSI